MKDYNGPVTLFWTTKDYMIGSDEARIALALNRGILKKSRTKAGVVYKGVKLIKTNPSYNF